MSHVGRQLGMFGAPRLAMMYVVADPMIRYCNPAQPVSHLSGISLSCQAMVVPLRAKPAPALVRGFHRQEKRAGDGAAGVQNAGDPSATYMFSAFLALQTPPPFCPRSKCGSPVILHLDYVPTYMSNHRGESYSKAETRMYISSAALCK